MTMLAPVLPAGDDPAPPVDELIPQHPEGPDVVPPGYVPKGDE